MMKNDVTITIKDKYKIKVANKKVGSVFFYKMNVAKNDNGLVGEEAWGWEFHPSIQRPSDGMILGISTAAEAFERLTKAYKDRYPF
jgi:phosphomannomutase